MFNKLHFYFKHSLNDLSVNKRLTFFALLAIAVGVAAVVSLQTLAVMIGDTLEGNLQATNRGDVSAQLESWADIDFDQGVRDGLFVKEELSFFGEEETNYRLSETGLAQIQDWIDSSEFAGAVEMTYPLSITHLLGIFTSTGVGTAVTDAETGYQKTSVSPILIDTAIYPFYSEIKTLDGEMLSDVMQAPTDIVVSKAIAEELELEIGDLVQLNGTEAEFTLRGVVETDMEVKNPITDIFAGLFGFYYLDQEAVTLFTDLTAGADKLYFKLADPTELDRFVDAFTNEFSYFDITTTEDWRELNEAIVENVAQAVTVMGLVSLLIGSIGIVNTMQVVVRRRTMEIAVLKTIGLQGEQVTLLFLSEAFIMGIFGSLAGIVLGWGMTIAIKGVAESVFATDIPFRIAPIPALNGFVVGMLVTTVFGFLPTLAAGQVRPSIVLRPLNGFVPRAGKSRTLVALLMMAVALTVIARGILGDGALAFVVIIGTFVAAAILYVILWLLIWLIGRLFPTFGSVDLKVSLRQMLAGRSRGASTLLALVIGVFSLSVITLFVDSTLDLLNSMLQEQGNVLINVPSRQSVNRVEEILDMAEGVEGYTTSLTYSAELIRFEDAETGLIHTPTQVKQLLHEADVQIDTPAFHDEGMFDADPEWILEDRLLKTEIEGHSLGDIQERETVTGRYLTPEDAGQNVIVLTENEVLTAIGIGVGDTLTYQINSKGGFFSDSSSEEITFTVVGVRSKEKEMMNFSNASSFAPVDAFPESLNPNTMFVVVDVDDEHVTALRRELNGIPGAFVLELSVFTRLINSLISTFTAFPTMVAALGLIVGGVVIANSVALSTMERRKEIAVMKAVGLQRERVLGMLLLENGLLGLVGGLIGVGISVAVLVVMNKVTDSPVSNINYVTVFGLMFLCVIISMVAALSSAWGASGEKPLNVLRYE